MSGIFSAYMSPGPVANPSAAGGGGLGGDVGGTPPDILQPTTTPGGTVRVGIACNIATPIMGGVFQQNPPSGEWVAWTGGKPNLNWTDLDPAQLAAAPTPTMYRSAGIKDVKGYAHRIKGLATPFGMKDDLRAFQRSVMKHFKQCGLDTITCLPDPANPTCMESIVKSTNRFTKDYVVTKIAEYEGFYDEYDRLNARTASDFVLSSISVSLDLDDHDQKDPHFVRESF
jgi:hypothetical protein